MDRKEIKSVARAALKNDRWLPVGTLFVGQLIAGLFPLILNGPMQYGINEYYVKSLNGEERKFKDIFCGFNSFGKLFLADLLMCLYMALWSLIPIVGPFIVIVKSFAYSQTLLILRDNPELTANEAITKSKEMMNGHKAQLFGLTLSFLGWMIVDCFTMGILGVLFVQPYMRFAEIEFYNRIK